MRQSARVFPHDMSSTREARETPERALQPLDDSDCAICLLSKQTLTSALTVTPCGHKFCEHCLESYANSLPAPGPTELRVVTMPCPMCRAVLGFKDMPSACAAILKSKSKTTHSSPNEQMQQLQCAPVICCCNVVGQLWQRVMGTPKWQCLAVSGALWLIFILAFGADFFATESYDKWAHPYDYTDGIALPEVSIITGPLFMLLFWLVAACVLKRIRDKLRRDELHSWHAAMRGIDESRTCNAAHALCGPLCCCLCLVCRVLPAVHRSDKEYSLCDVLDTAPDPAETRPDPADTPPPAVPIERTPVEPFSLSAPASPPAATGHSPARPAAPLGLAVV